MQTALSKSHLIHGLGLSRLGTDFRELLRPIFLSTSICLPRIMGVYLLVSQCWADSGPTGPLLTVDRDEVLLMMLTKLGTASRSLAFWFVTLGIRIKSFRVIPCKLLCRYL